MIDLHYWPTPNGKKVTILLEECGLLYKIVPCNIQRGDQFTPEFLTMNPNHRMPVMVDHEPKGGGAPVEVKMASLAGDVRLGRHVLHHPRVAVHPLPADIPSRVTIGTRVLRNFSVAIDQRSMAVRLTRADTGAVPLPE
jgi:hypothetical protein